jgi:hypothetical protein
MRNGKAAAICLFVLFSMVSYSAFCGDGIQAGPLRIRPFVDVTVTSDSNVYLLPEDEELDDLFYTVTPRVICEFPFQAHMFSLDYGIAVRRFSDYDTEDTELQNLLFRGEVVANSQLNFIVSEHYRERAGDVDEIIGRVEYSRNAFDVTGHYDLSSKIAIEAMYANLKYDYEDETLTGRTESHFGGTVIYNLYDRWSVLGELVHGEVDIDDPSEDASFNRFLVGARGEFTPRLTGEVKAGWESRTYDGDREDNDVGYIDGSVVHEVASDMRLEVGATRELVESITYTGTAYTLTRGYASLTKDFADRISLVLSGYFQKNEYDEPVPRGDTFAERQDDSWQAQVGVEYRLNRYARVIAGIEHKNNDSNLDENDYKYNRFTVGARLEY